MALKVGELFATLKLDDKDFTKSIKSAGKQQDTLKSAIASTEKSIDRYASSLDSVKKALQSAMKAQDTNIDKLEKAKATQSALQQEIDRLNAAYKAQVKATGENSDAANELGLKLLDTKDALSKTNGEIRKLTTESKNGDKNISKLNQSVDNISDNLGSAKAQLSKFKAELNAANAILTSNAAKLDAASVKMKQYASSAKTATEWQRKLGNTLTAGVTTPIVAGLGYAANETIDFEDAFAGVEKTVNASDAELESLKQTFIALSEDIPVTKEELAAIGEQAGQLNIAIDVIDDFTETIANLNASTNLGEDAASNLAQFANITGMKQTGENFDALGSAIVDLGNNSATSEDKIVSMALRLAGAGTNAKMSQADILGIATALSSLGIEAEMGGSAFSRLINNMLIAVETGSDDLKGFAEVAGMTSEQFQIAFRENAAGALSDFIVGLGNNSKTAIQIMDELGITELRLTDALSRTANASGLFASSISRANTAWKENTALSIEAEKRYKTTSSRLKMLKNRIDNTAMSFGDAMLPILEDTMEGIDGLIDRFAGLDEATRSNIVSAGLYVAAAGPALKLLGTANSVLSTIIGGLGSLASATAAAGGGFMGLRTAILKGIGSALGPAGLLLTVGVGVAVAWDLLKPEEYQPNLSGKVAEVLKNMDPISDEIVAKVTADFELSEETQIKITEFANSAHGLYGEIETALTDGKPDTPKVVTGLRDNITGLYSDVRTAIQHWFDAEMAKLDLSTTEGQQQLEWLTQQRDQYIAEADATEQATNDWVTTWAGASTALVKQHVNELDTLLAKITSLNEEIQVREELARSVQRYSFDVVSMGQTNNTETISEALNYSYLNWGLDYNKIEQYAKEQFRLANEAFSIGGETWTEFMKNSGMFDQLGENAVYADWEALFSANQDAQIAAASDAYMNNLKSVFDGIMKSYGEAGALFQTDLSKYMAGTQAINFADSALELLDTTSLYKMTPEQKSSIQNSIDSLLQNYVAVIGEEFSGSQTLKNAFESGDTLTLSSVLNGLQSELTTEIGNLESSLTSALESGDLAGINDAIRLVLQSSMLEGVAGVDISSVDSQLGVLFTTLGSDMAGGIGTGMTGYDFSSDASTTVQNVENSLGAKAGQGSPCTEFMPLGNDISAGIGVGMKDFDFSTDSASVVSSILTGFSGKMANMKSVGLDFSRGLAAGIRAGRTIVTSAAAAVAQAAADAAKSTLKIHSPSKVTEGFGLYFGKGFAKGILGTTNLVTGVATDLARSAANATSIRNPGAHVQTTYTASANSRRTEIDYDRLADAMNQRPMVLTQDGRVIARLQTRNTAQAQNSYAHSVALGYGK